MMKLQKNIRKIRKRKIRGGESFKKYFSLCRNILTFYKMTKDEITVDNFLKGEDIFSTGKITSRTNIPILYNNKKAILKVDGEMWRISDF